MGMCVQKEPRGYDKLDQFGSNKIHKFSQPKLSMDFSKKTYNDDYFEKLDLQKKKKQQQRDRKIVQFLQQKKQKQKPINFNIFKLSKDKQAENSKYGKKLHLYRYYYGKSVDDQLKKFIQDNYSHQYYSTVIKSNGQRVITSKYQMVDRFETAHKNTFQIWRLNYKSVDLANKKISVQIIIWNRNNNKETFYYNVEIQFDEEDRFLKAEWKQYVPYEPYKVRPLTSQFDSKPKPSFDSSSNNNYYGPPDTGIDYNAQVQRSNQQFRQRMNKQAQQWNDYARQKNSRGY